MIFETDYKAGMEKCWHIPTSAHDQKKRFAARVRRSATSQIHDDYHLLFLFDREFDSLCTEKATDQTIPTRVCSWKAAGRPWFPYRPRGRPNVVHTIGGKPGSHK
jgi:hypothetical protein